MTTPPSTQSRTLQFCVRGQRLNDWNGLLLPSFCHKSLIDPCEQVNIAYLADKRGERERTPTFRSGPRRTTVDSHSSACLSYARKRVIFVAVSSCISAELAIGREKTVHVASASPRVIQRALLTGVKGLWVICAPILHFDKRMHRMILQTSKEGWYVATEEAKVPPKQPDSVLT